MNNILHYLILLVGLSTTSIAQNLSIQSELENTVNLYNGSQIQLSEVTLKKPLFSENYFKNGVNKILASKVQWFTTETKFYANLKTNKGVFVERIFEGKINIYAGETFSTLTVNDLNYQSSKLLSYYNIENGPLQKVRYQPILDLVKNNKISMQYMRQYRVKKTVSRIIGITSALIFAGNLASYIYKGQTNNRDINRDVTGELIGMGFGCVGLVSSWMIGNNKKELLLKAIQSY